MSKAFKITKRISDVIFRKKFWTDFPFYVECFGNENSTSNKVYKSLVYKKRNWMSTKEFKTVKKTSFSILCNQLDEEEIYQLLAKYKIQNLEKKDLFPVEKFEKAHKAYSCLINDLHIKNYNKNHLILTKNALLHNFMNEITEIHFNKYSGLKSFLKNRAVIYCYHDKHEAKLEEYIKILEQYQVSILRVNTNDGFWRNSKKINQFLNQLKLQK